MKDEGRSFIQGTERGPLYGSSALPLRGIERPLCPGDHTVIITCSHWLGNVGKLFMIFHDSLWHPMAAMWNIDISCSATVTLLNL